MTNITLSDAINVNTSGITAKIAILDKNPVQSVQEIMQPTLVLQL